MKISHFELQVNRWMGDWLKCWFDVISFTIRRRRFFFSIRVHSNKRNGWKKRLNRKSFGFCRARALARLMNVCVHSQCHSADFWGNLISALFTFFVIAEKWLAAISLCAMLNIGNWLVLYNIVRHRGERNRRIIGEFMASKAEKAFLGGNSFVHIQMICNDYWIYDFLRFAALIWRPSHVVACIWPSMRLDFVSHSIKLIEKSLEKKHANVDRHQTGPRSTRTRD